MKIGKIKFSICTFQIAISNITGDVIREWESVESGESGGESGIRGHIT